MRRVVVTGMGIVSPIGNDVEEVALSLREAESLRGAMHVAMDLGVPLVAPPGSSQLQI